MPHPKSAKPKRRPKPPPRGAARPRSVRPPRVLVVGFGRVGGVLALGLQRAGWPVSVLPRSDEAVRRAAALGLPLADLDALADAELCLLAVPDRAVGEAATLVAEDVGPAAALVHCSGALPLDAIGVAPERGGRPRGSFHPLVAISDPQDELAGAAVAVAADDASLRDRLVRMAAALDLTPLDVPEAGRTAYHAGAVMSAGLLVALADAAVAALAQAGLDRQTALPALLPLMRSALRGVELRGLERALTGPVTRGDLAVVQAHLAALPGELGAVYRLLSRRALALTPGLPAESRAALERTLA